MLATAGMLTLPSATIGEKAFIIGVCVALSVAGRAGAGLWQRKPRFDATVIAAGGLAIACLGGLAVTASSESGDRPPAAGIASPPSSPASPGASSLASPTLSVGQTSGTAPQYLVGLHSDPGTTDDPQTGTWNIQRRNYPNSIGYQAIKHEEVVTYQLHHPYCRFEATVGLNEGADAEDDGTPVSFTVSAKLNDRRMVQFEYPGVKWLNPEPINVTICGATTLILETFPGGHGLFGRDTIAVWGDARRYYPPDITLRSCLFTATGIQGTQVITWQHRTPRRLAGSTSEESSRTCHLPLR